MTLTEQDLTALRALRQRGFAVCVFEPGEMPPSKRRRVRALNFADRALFPIW